MVGSFIWATIFERLKLGEHPIFFSKFLAKSFVNRYIGKVKKSGSFLYGPVAATSILKCRGHFESLPVLNRVNSDDVVDLRLLAMEVEFPGGWWVVVVNSNNRVRPNSVELSWGCVEVELGLWQKVPGTSPSLSRRQVYTTRSKITFHKTTKGC